LNTNGTNPAIAGNPGTCRYGQFDGVDDYVQLPSSISDLTGSFTITAWINAEGLNAGSRIFLDDQNNSQGYALSLGDPGAGKLRFFSRGVSPVSVDTQNAVISTDNWYFVAAVHDVASKTRMIYIDGVAVDLSTGSTVSTYTGPWGSDSGPASIGGETNASSEAGRFNGAIDETRVYSTALTAVQIATIMGESHACSSTVIDHIQITHDGQALTCADETLTIKACTNAACTNVSDSNVVVNLSATGATSSWSQNPLTIPANSTAGVAVSLTHRTVETITLSATSTPAATNSVVCVPDCDLNFSDSGFILSLSDHQSCTTPNLIIQAVQLSATGNSCAPAYSGDQSVNVAFNYKNPVTGSRIPILNLSNMAAANVTQNRTINFDATASSTLSFQYNDAGQVDVTVSDGADNGLVSKTVSPIVSPAKLLISTSDANNACTGPNYSNCSAFKVAGTGDTASEFALDISGACSDNSVTPNFQLNTIVLSSNLVAPDPATGANASLGTNSADITTDGTVTVTQTISEVGAFSITATPPRYLGLPSNAIPTATSSTIGRFTPHHFAITSPDNGMLAASCSGSFTYIGQEFGYSDAPSFIIEAQNTLNVPTVNYQGTDWAKIRGSSVYAVSTVTEDDTHVGTDGTKLSIYHELPTNRINIDSDNGNGTFNASFGADVFCYGSDDLVSNDGCDKTVESQVSPFYSDIKITLSSIGDGDITTHLTQVFSPTASQQRFGRLSMDNTFGSELVDLTMPMYTEIFDGSNFVINTADNCTTVDDSISNELDVDRDLTGGSSDITVSSIEASMGILNVDLTSPGANNTGFIDVTPNLDVSGDAWLKYDWDVSVPGFENPSGRATFGIYKGNPVQIYIQQTYQQ
jgi:MSHA biogenesis protein MshQ